MELLVWSEWSGELNKYDVRLELRLPVSSSRPDALDERFQSPICLWGETLTSHWGCWGSNGHGLTYRSRTIDLRLSREAIPVFTKAIWESTQALVSGIIQVNLMMAKNQTTEHWSVDLADL